MVNHWGKPIAFVLFILIIFPSTEAFSQWTKGVGSGWVDISGFHHQTKNRFDEDGSVERLFGTAGESTTRSLVLASEIGIFTGVDLGLSVPFHFLSFDDLAGNRSSQGIGDLRLSARISNQLVSLPKFPLAIAIRPGIKIPVQEFDVDSEIIPLTEGQTDYELALEIGRSLWPRQIYVQSWLGYRWRTLNKGIARKPGDEWFGYVAMGGTYNRIEWKIALEGFTGRTPLILGLPIPSARRRLLRVEPKIGLTLGPGVVASGIAIPVAGQNYLAGSTFFAGYFIQI